MGNATFSQRILAGVGLFCGLMAIGMIISIKSTVSDINVLDIYITILIVLHVVLSFAFKLRLIVGVSTKFIGFMSFLSILSAVSLVMSSLPTTFASELYSHTALDTAMHNLTFWGWVVSDVICLVIRNKNMSNTASNALT